MQWLYIVVQEQAYRCCFNKKFVDAVLSIRLYVLPIHPLQLAISLVDQWQE